MNEFMGDSTERIGPTNLKGRTNSLPQNILGKRLNAKIRDNIIDLILHRAQTASVINSSKQNKYDLIQTIQIGGTLNPGT